MNSKLAILIDGGFLTKALAVRNGKFPETREVEAGCGRIRKHPDLAGLDIARISLRQTAQVVVAVTGDSDLIPAFKFARREGVRIYLDHLGLPIRRELKVHADIVI